MPLNLRLSFAPIPSTPSPSIHLPQSLRFPSQLFLTPSMRHWRRHLLRASCSNSDDFSDELDRLLVLLPQELRWSLETHPELLHLIEIVMDLGRPPLARFPAGDFLLSERPIASQDLHHATLQIGDFAGDNRAGISRTLHRISAIRNRKGGIVGLTCRVGRAVPGSANMLRDLVMDGGSLLLIGPPGVGKTTIIRDIARMLADDYKKRVMIVDTSNEIGGDGDIPHAGIGSARRMQVPNFDAQHKVLIEAVENHMPQVIVIDEIGTKLEAMAASTIAQRGIQLVATAHGVTIENLTMNPSLEMLVGGIQSVTLGDEEASRRGVQKTVLERKGPSTFTCGAEIISKNEVQVHRNLEATVDALLAGHSPKFEVRKIDPKSSTFETLHLQMESPEEVDAHLEHAVTVEEDTLNYDEMTPNTFNLEFDDNVAGRSSEAVAGIHLFVYGIAEASVLQAIKRLGMDKAIGLADNISEADAFLVLHSKLKKNSQIQAFAKSRGIPIHIIKTSSVLQITKAICALTTENLKATKESEAENNFCPSEKMDALETSSMMHVAKANNSSTAEPAKRFKELEANDKVHSLEETDALEEVRLAIEQVVIPKGEQVQLLPRSSHILSIQIELIERYKLKWEKVGRDPYVSLCVYSLPLDSTERKSSNQAADTASELRDLLRSDGINSSHNGIARLPLLPE